MISPQRLDENELIPHTATPFLPDTFAVRERHGYVFEFQGQDCTHTSKYLESLTGLCWTGVYVARPAVDQKGNTYAYFAADDRVHYRRDGFDPSTADLTIDN